MPATSEARELESSLEAFFRRRVRLAGGYTIKLAPTEAGVPDRLVLMPGGKMYLVELKAHGGQVSTIQRVVHERLRHYGTYVWVLTGRAEIIDWIRRVVEATARSTRRPGPPPK